MNIDLKKYKLIILFSMFCLTISAQNSYTIEFDEKNFSFDKVNNILYIASTNPNGYYSEDMEKPAFPYYSFRIVRPLVSTFENYRITFKKDILYKNVSIGTNPAICSTDKALAKDSVKIATSSADSPILYSKLHHQYGYDYTYFLITPFEYDTKTKDLYFISEITINYESSRCEKSEKKYDEAKRAYMKGIVINPDEVDNFYPNTLTTQRDGKSITSSSKATSSIENGNWDYVIITSETLKPAFQDLIEWKIQKGLRAKVFTLEEIYAYPTSQNQSTNQGKIKAWIRYMYLYSGLKYVLLGGDASIVPVKYCYGRYPEDGNIMSEYVPADLYYANCSFYFQDWDYNGNGKPGEYGDLIEMTPDVYVTRLPVKTNDDVLYCTQKILQYEKGNGLFNPLYVNKMLFAGTGLTNFNVYNNSAYCLDEQAYSAFIEPYWNGNRDYLYYVDNNTYTNLTSYNTLNPNNLQQLLNSGYHFFHIDCHGGSSYWNLISGNFSNSNASGCINTSGNIIVTTSCQSNAFDQDCLSKTFMNSTHGSVAYFGSSRQGLRYTRENSVPAIGISLLIDANFFKNLLTGYPVDAPYHFGAVAAYTKQMFLDEANVNDTNGYRYLQFAVNPLGDPEMPIYTSAPQNFTGIQVDVNGNGDVNVTTGGVSGCTIALTSIDNGISYFVVQENVSSCTFHNVFSRCYLTITKHNYRPYRSSIDYPGIQGDSKMYSFGAYSISVPDDCTVTWSFANTNSENNSLIHASLNPNECYISNSNLNYIRESLVATIKRNNVVVATRSKLVTTGGGFRASLYQQGKTIGNITYPSHTFTIGDGGHYPVYPLNPVTLTSSDFPDAVFTRTGCPTVSWLNNPDSTIMAVFVNPTGSTQQAIVTGVNNVTQKIFRFYLQIVPANTSKSIEISAEGPEYSISLIAKESESPSITREEIWDMTIYDVLSGETIYQEKGIGGSAKVNTSGWKPGIYIIKGRMGDVVTTEKLYIK